MAVLDRQHFGITSENAKTALDACLDFNGDGLPLSCVCVTGQKTTSTLWFELLDFIQYAAVEKKQKSASEFLAALILKNREKILWPRLKVLRKNFAGLARLVKKNEKIFSLIRPRGGATAFINYNLKIKSDDFCRELIKKYDTLLVPGSVYGLENYFRIGLSARPEIFQTGLKNLEKFIGQFNVK